MAELYQSCDSLQARMEKELELSEVRNQKADSVIAIGEKRIRLEAEGSKILQKQVTVMEQMNGELRHQVRQQKILTVAVGVLGVLALIIIL